MLASAGVDFVHKEAGVRRNPSEVVHLARSAGGHIVFESGTSKDGELALVYTLFGGKELYGPVRQAQEE